MNSEAKNLIIEQIPKLRKLSEKFLHYQGAHIDLERIICFLTQFETAKKIQIVINLLDRVEFIDSARMTYLLKKAYKEIEPELLKKPILSSLGTIQDSSSMICYQLLKDLFDNEEEAASKIEDINSIGRRIEELSPSCIVLFDDNITSGTQLKDFFREWIEGGDNAEMISEPLTESQFKLLQNISIRICYAIQLAEISNAAVDEIRKKYGLDLRIHRGKVDYTNYLDFQASTMRSEIEAEFTQVFLSEIAAPLYEDKNWSKDKLYHRLLGYGNLGKLTVFYYNVPKSLIPVFWKFGTFKGHSWIPLFPESQERKKIQKAGADFSFVLKEAVKSWMQSGGAKRKPILSFGILTNQGLSELCNVDVPSKGLIEFTVNEFFKEKGIDSMFAPSSHGGKSWKSIYLNDLTGPILTQEQWENYDEAVLKFNGLLNSFLREISIHEYRIFSQRRVVFTLENSGSKSGTNFRAKVFFNTSDILIGSYDLPEPRFHAKRPKPAEFGSQLITIKREPLTSALYNDFVTAQDPTVDPLYSYQNLSIKLLEGNSIGHNDTVEGEFSILRVNSNFSEIALPYEVNHEEEAATQKGKIKFIFKEVDIFDELEIRELERRLEIYYDQIKNSQK